MKSRASFKSHPLHPALVAFPIAFMVGCLLADLAGWLFAWESVWFTGALLSIAAVVTGVAAGVPGLIDYLAVVPPDSSAKRRATWHMDVNLTALGCIALGWVFRDLDTFAPRLGTVLLEAAGVGLVTWGGWMGAILVYRNQIGVDHRYAGAGKWNEQTVEAAPGQTVAVANADELKVGQMKLLHVAGRRIVLARTDDGWAAFDDHCTHRGGPLADGVLICSTVQCPWHGSAFDVKTGAVKAGPADKAIGVYRVEESAGEVLLVVPAR
jgi:nitrite reductase/ring-hydroxylating ferredoxin subunit/uncharacterized membrane protein